MKYINVEEFDVNFPDKAPLKDFFLLTGGFLAVLFILFLISGFFVDSIIYSLPESISAKIESKIMNTANFQKINFSKYSLAEENKLQKIVNFLTSGDKKLQNRKFKVFVVHSKEVNAFAIPGSKILVTDSLLKEIDNKNEINFVLAHELGHFAHKDHLKSLGRQFILLGLSTVFLGENSSATNFLINSIGKMELKYSQKQELKADLFAVDLLYKKYGDAECAIAFMKKISGKNKLDKFVYFFATHPHPEVRIDAIKNEINRLKYNT